MTVSEDPGRTPVCHDRYAQRFSLVYASLLHYNHTEFLMRRTTTLIHRVVGAPVSSWCNLSWEPARCRAEERNGRANSAVLEGHMFVSHRVHNANLIQDKLLCKMS
jgi:hypothetical protein